MPNTLLSPVKVAEALQITTRQLYRYLKAGILPEPKHNQLLSGPDAKEPKRRRLWLQAEVEEAAAILKKERSGLRTLLLRAPAMNAYLMSGIDRLSSEEVTALLHISPSRLNYLTSAQCERDNGCRLNVAGRNSDRTRQFDPQDVYQFMQNFQHRRFSRSLEDHWTSTIRGRHPSSQHNQVPLEPQVPANPPSRPAYQAMAQGEATEESLPSYTEVKQQSEMVAQQPNELLLKTGGSDVTASPIGAESKPDVPKQPQIATIDVDFVAALKASLK